MKWNPKVETLVLLRLIARRGYQLCRLQNSEIITYKYRTDYYHPQDFNLQPSWKMSKQITSRNEQKAVIHRLLDGKTAIHTAATELASVALSDPTLEKEFEDDEDKEDALACVIESIWRSAFEAFGQVPDGVQTIFDLLLCMSRLPPALDKSGRQLCTSTDPIQRIWQDVPNLGVVIHGEWNRESSDVLPTPVKRCWKLTRHGARPGKPPTRSDARLCQPALRRGERADCKTHVTRLGKV